MIVYCAGPLTQGLSREANCREAVRVGNELRRMGIRPYVPHVWDLVGIDTDEFDYEYWMEEDFEFLSKCDALLLLPGYSPGAEREVKRAEELGVPVYHSVWHVVRGYG